MRAPIIGLHTTILSPASKEGSIESDGILKELKQNTCMKIKAINSIDPMPIIHTMMLMNMLIVFPPFLFICCIVYNHFKYPFW